MERNGSVEAPVEIRILIPDEVEADRSLQIDNNPKLRLLLRDWEKNYKVARERIEKKETRTINAKAELYQLLGFYSVFQGVVLTAVAQSNTLYCLSSWGPASLSLLASAVTVVSVHYKLTNYSRLKVALKDERTNAVVSFSKQIFWFTIAKFRGVREGGMEKERNGERESDFFLPFC